MSLNRIFVITGDASGDIHGSVAIRRFQQLLPQLEIEAIGGPQIAATGVKIFHSQQKMGVLGAGVFAAMPTHYLLGQRLIRYLKGWKPDAVLLIDYGMFNLWIAGKLKRLGIRVFYYIPPQVWASRGGRIHRIQRDIDHVFGIFPFEEALYRSYGIPFTFVGHPLLEQLPPRPDRTVFCKAHGLDPALPIIGLFPGSRKLEIQSLLRPMIKALPLIQQRSDQPLQFLLARSSAVSEDFFHHHFAPVKPLTEALSFQMLTLENHEILALSQAALVASGTVTLEAALYDTPTVVSYKISPLAFWVFQNFAYVKQIGLPNLLLEETFLPELLMNQVTPESFEASIAPFLSETPTWHKTQQCFSRLKSLLGNEPASLNLVRAISALMNEKIVEVEY
jgi:lipid-A-disaccharide synthase